MHGERQYSNEKNEDRARLGRRNAAKGRAGRPLPAAARQAVSAVAIAPPLLIAPRARVSISISEHGVARVSNLLYRRASSLQVVRIATPVCIFGGLPIEIGDTAAWKPALPKTEMLIGPARLIFRT